MDEFQLARHIACFPSVSVNWFIAWPVGIEPAWWESLTRPPAGIRLFHRQDIHLTGVFLGNCGENTAMASWEAVRASPPAEVVVCAATMRPFGPSGRFSALSLTVVQEHNHAIAEQIREVQRVALGASGVEPDSREPVPHATIARPQRHADDVTRRQALLWASRVIPPSEPWILDRIALYTWADRRDEQLFRIVDEIGCK